MPVSLRKLELDDDLLRRAALQPLTWPPKNARAGDGIVEDDDGTLFLVRESALTDGEYRTFRIDGPGSTLKELRYLLGRLQVA